MGLFSSLLNTIFPNRLASLSRKQILAKYGPPDENYQAKNCVLWNIRNDFPWFPAKRIFINRELKDKLFLAFTELQKEGLHTEIKTCDGCFEIRNTRGTSLPSLHSWAMAIDLNASTEKLGQKKTNFSDRFIAIMTKYVFWGGNFISRKDPMHFGLYNE